MRFMTCVAVALAAVVLSSGVSAQPRPGGGAGSSPFANPPASGGALITEYNADQIAQLFSAAGFPSKAVVTKDNAHIVQTEFWPNTASGVAAAYCTKSGGACHAIKIMAIFVNAASVGDTWINAWNSQFFFVRGYKSGKDLVFTWDILLYPGVSADYIKTAAAVFKSIVDESANFKP